MTELFDDKYRIKFLRLSKRDYSQPGSYFITICTQDQKSYFGKVIDGDVKLNEIEKIIQDIWSEIPEHFKNVELDICIIIPNHIHGIITINESNPVETSIYGVSSTNVTVSKSIHSFSKYNTPLLSLAPVVRFLQTVCCEEKGSLCNLSYS